LIEIIIHITQNIKKCGQVLS